MTPERIRLIIAVCLGLVIGFIARPAFLSDRFAIYVVHETGPIRIDRHTGQSWQYAPSESGEMVWKPIRID